MSSTINSKQFSTNENNWYTWGTMIEVSIGASTLVVKMKKGKDHREIDARQWWGRRKKNEEVLFWWCSRCCRNCSVLDHSIDCVSISLFGVVIGDEILLCFFLTFDWSSWSALGEEGESWIALDSQNFWNKGRRLVTVRAVLIQINCSLFQSILQFICKAVTFRLRSKLT